jgi:hypothetical protein
MCALKIGDAAQAASKAASALAASPGNVKALFRRGCAYLALSRFDEVFF